MTSIWLQLTKAIRPRNDADDRSFASGELEYERFDDERSEVTALSKPLNWPLILAFLSLVVTGTANMVFMKLQAGPLYNYPNFLNLFGCIIFIPVFFLYIIPAYKFGWFNCSITEQQWNMSKRPFMIMGALDCLSCMMTVFSAVYLPGPLLVLLPQASIPLSMIISRKVLKKRYRALQYVGAFVVVVGICVVLEPEWTQRNKADYICEAIDLNHHCTLCQLEDSEDACLSHRLDVNPVRDLIDYQLRSHIMFSNISAITDDDEGTPICEWISADSTDTREQGLVLIWSGVLLFSCVPMTISTIYKEVVLEDDMDPMFLNAWIVVFQTLYSIVLMVPAGMLSSPQVMPRDLPENLVNGLQCYLGHGAIEEGCHPDDHCDVAAFYYNWALVACLLYLLSSMFCIKLGSTSLLFLGLTIMVPLGNLIFAMPFMPSPATFHTSDLMGLITILLGLLMYRGSSFGADAGNETMADMEVQSEQASVQDNDLVEPLLPPAPRTGDV